jgi:hypothetical protein
MRRLLVQLAGGYAGIGALAFVIHRTRYRATRQLREWTDRRSHELTSELERLRAELQAARRQLRRHRHLRRVHPANQKPPLVRSGGQMRGAEAA